MKHDSNPLKEPLKRLLKSLKRIGTPKKALEKDRIPLKKALITASASQAQAAQILRDPCWEGRTKQWEGPDQNRPKQVNVYKKG